MDVPIVNEGAGNATGTTICWDLLLTNFYNYHHTMGEYGVYEGYCRRRTAVR
jgi:hypothetical protein